MVVMRLMHTTQLVRRNTWVVSIVSRNCAINCLRSRLGTNTTRERGIRLAQKVKSESVFTFNFFTFYLGREDAAVFSVANDPVGDDIIGAILINIDLPSGVAGCVRKPARATLKSVS